LIFRQLLGLVLLLGRTSTTKDIELLALIIHRVRRSASAFAAVDLHLRC
jgi:hypothetical protein